MSYKKCETDEMIKQMLESDKTELQKFINDTMRKAVTANTDTAVVVSTPFGNRPDSIYVNEIEKGKDLTESPLCSWEEYKDTEDTLEIPSDIPYSVDVDEDEKVQARAKLSRSAEVRFFLANVIAIYPEAIPLKYRSLKSERKVVTQDDLSRIEKAKQKRERKAKSKKDKKEKLMRKAVEFQMKQLPRKRNKKGRSHAKR